jgi:hypothetical protein
MKCENDPNRYQYNALADIVTTLNYAMLKSPIKLHFPKDAPVKELKFELNRKYEPLCLEFRQQSSF